MDLPSLVPEVPLDLAADAGRGVSRQAVADLRVVVVDGLEQADVAHLHKVFGRLGAATVLPDAGADQFLVPLYQDLARGGALVAVWCRRAEAPEEFVIRQLPQLRAEAWGWGQGASLRHCHLRVSRNDGRNLVCPHHGV